MRYESFIWKRSTFFKITLAEPHRILFKSPYSPANNHCGAFFLRSHFNEIIRDTFEPDNMHGLS